MLASPLPPTFSETYSLSKSSLRCNALCMVIISLALLSIYISSSLVLLRKGPEYLTKGTAPITIGIIFTFMFDSCFFFKSLARSKHFSFFSHSFSFILLSAGTVKSTILQVLFFIVDHNEVWSSGRDYVIGLYVNVP